MAHLKKLIAAWIVIVGLAALWAHPQTNPALSTKAHAQTIGCGWGMISGCGGGSTVIPNFTANAGLPHWKTCRANVIANTGNCLVLFIGESTTSGQGTLYSANSNDNRSTAFPSEVSAILTAEYGINSSATSVAGDQNVGNAAAYAAYDTRTVFTNWFAADGGIITIGHEGLGSGTGGGTLTFNPADTTTFPSNVHNTNALEFWGAALLTAGSIAVNVNGGSTLGTINENVSSVYLHQVITTGAGAAANTWNFVCTPSSLGCHLGVIRAYNSAVSEASMVNAGWDGATVANWNTSTSSPWDPLPAIETVAPTLCVITIYGNDAIAGTAVATYKASLQNIITACLASGDVLLDTDNVLNPTVTCSGGAGGLCDYGTQHNYEQAIISLATTNNVPVLDYWNIMCGWTGSTCARGFLTGMGQAWNAVLTTTPDGAHQGVAASLQANLIAQILAQ
jgi:hypothetical protein